MQPREWIFPEPPPAGFSPVPGLPAPLPEILWRRGFRGVDAVAGFLSPMLRDLSDPFLLPAMEEAADRLLRAVDRGERVALYGDYDADGITSVAIVARVLRAYGLDPRPFLPHRIEEGYGISEAGLARCIEEHAPSLVVALDCGSSSADSIRWLRGRGIDAVVFDHHEMKGPPPDCPTVNPKLGGRFRYLCTAGIAFKLGHALLKKRPRGGFDLKTCLDLAAIGTVADVVPLVEENRILASKGLAALAETRWAGLRELAAVSGIRPPYSAVDLGYRLGPRLNAAGRLGTAAAALDLLLCDDEARARDLAVELDERNRERQALEQQLLDRARSRLEGSFDPGSDPAIVLGEEGWHPGILGIVASRLAREFHRPTVLVGFDAGGNGKGSGRGVPGFSLVAALAECGEHLLAHGGHELAAGLSVARERFDAFREAFLTVARRAFERPPRATIGIDGRLDLSRCDLGFLAAHERLQPYGTDNPQPVFYAPGVSPAGPPRMLKEKHTALELAQEGGRHRAIFFNRTPDRLPPAPWDVAFRVARNVFRGNEEVSIQVEEIRTSPGDR